MRKRLTYKQAENLFALLAAFLGLLVYWKTLCPTVNFIDSGELATDCYTLGIAHPTGYPLFLVLGHLFSLLPLGLRPIHQLNLFAAVACSVSLFFFFKFLVFFLNEFLLKGKSQQKIQHEYSLFTFVPALGATLALGFSETFWEQALSIEVYSLHLVYLSLLLWIFTHALKSDLDNSERKDGKGDSRYWYAFAYVLGLSFTNHLTTGFLAPATITAYFYVSGFTKQAWKRIGVMALPFAVGGSAYLFLPIRAMNHPVMNWGNPVDVERLMWHFSGKVYHVWFLDSMDSVIKQFTFFVTTLPAEFAYLGLLVALVGVWSLFRESRQGFVFTFLLFAACAVIASFYDIHDIDNYYLLADIAVGIWIGFGIKYFLELKPKLDYKYSVTVGVLLLAALVCAYNYNKVDESKTTIVENYAKDVFQSVKQNAVILSFQWDYFVSAAYYLQIVEGYRPDVVVIDKELMRRSWYYEQMKTRYPWLYNQSKVEIDDFMKELYKFEHELPYTSAIETDYAKLMHSFIEKNWSTRPVYMTPEIEQQYVSSYKKIPSGLTLQLFPLTDTLDHHEENAGFHIDVPSRMDKYRSGILSMYGRAFYNRSLYLQSLHKTREADSLMALGKDLEQYVTPME